MATLEMEQMLMDIISRLENGGPSLTSVRPWPHSASHQVPAQELGLSSWRMQSLETMAAGLLE